MRGLIVTLLLVVYTTSIMAQEQPKKLKKEVEVTKAYNPTVDDAKKLNFTPTEKDTATYNPTFKYEIKSNPIETPQQILTLDAAKVGKSAPENVGLGYAKAGFGNYTTPYAELFINQRKSKGNSLGLHFKHISSNGDVELNNGEDANAAYSNNFINLFVQTYGRKAEWDIELLFDRNRITYYGYPWESPIPLNNDGSYMIWLQNQKQVFQKWQAKVAVKSVDQRDDWQYDLKLKAYTFNTTTDQKELFIGTKYDVYKKLDELNLGANGELFFVNNDHISYSRIMIPELIESSVEKRSAFFFRLNPYIALSGDDWKLKAGIRTDFVGEKDTTFKFRVAPLLEAQYQLSPEYLTVFINATGGTNPNLYAQQFYPNPYRDPYIQLRNSFTPYQVQFGFKGRLSKTVSFVTYAQYGEIKDRAFNQNTTPKPIPLAVGNSPYYYNTFAPQYYDVNLFKAYAEVMLTTTDKFNFMLKGNLYSWTLLDSKETARISGEPKFDLTFNSRYKYNKQLSFTANLFVEGKREYYFTRNQGFPVSNLEYFSIETDPIVDLSVGGEYRYTDQWHFWVQMNNLLFRKHERYIGYREQRFNAMIGVGYSF